MKSNYYPHQYIRERHIRGLLLESNTIKTFLMEYAHRNLLEIEKWSQLLEELLKVYPYLDPQHVTSKLNN